MLEFNTVVASSSNGGSVALSDDDIIQVRAVVDVLEQTSRYHSSKIPRSGVSILARAISTWPSAQAFPLIDIARVLLSLPDGANAAASPETRDILLPALCTAASCNSPDVRPATLLAGRALGNAMRQASTRALLGGERIATVIASLLTHPHTSVRSTGAILAANVAHASLVAEEVLAGGAGTFLNSGRPLLLASLSTALTTSADPSPTSEARDESSISLLALAVGTIMFCDATTTRAGVADGKIAGLEMALEKTAASCSPGAISGTWEIAQEALRLVRL